LAGPVAEVVVKLCDIGARKVSNAVLAKDGADEVIYGR
jgi:hypothetical protein